MKHASSLALGIGLLSCVVLPVSQASATILEIFPANADSSRNEELENLANGLKPGDVLILHGGTYTQTSRRAITVNGAAPSPITIRAPDGEAPIFTRPQPANFGYDQNNIEVVSSSYLVIKGLHFKGGDGGVSFVGGHHIIFEGNEIYETGNNALRMNSGNTDSFIIRGNHIHHTGLLASSVGTTEGEGMYIGCNNATCIATNHHIEGNYIHRTRATSNGGNDGIEIKVGSYGNTVRNNVIHDTTSGMQYPCIFVYGGGNRLNIVEGNAMLNCGEAIQVVSDAIVRNNLILNSTNGITAAPHAQVPQMHNVTIVNNTIYGHSDCLFVRWSGASNMVLANNAVYCPGATAVNGAGLTGGTTTIRSNYEEDSRDLRQGQGKGRRGRARHRLLRRDGRPLPHPRYRHLLRRRDHHRASAPGRDRRRRGPQERHRHRRLQAPGPYRPAILRPGRLDVKIKIERPDRGSAADIFAKYLTADIPFAESETRGTDVATVIPAMIAATVEAMYALSEENRFLESVVRRAKKLALKRYIGRGEKGIMSDDLLTAVREEFMENEDLPNTTNPDDWAKIAGKKGERIVSVKPLSGEVPSQKRNVETVVTTGQSL